MNYDQIKELALANGFKLKEQPNGAMDLNPYVYEFATALLKTQDHYSAPLAQGRLYQTLAQSRLYQIMNMQAEIDALKAESAQAYNEAAYLAKALFKKHYADQECYTSGQIAWGLCDTTAGIITQIDNMVCGLHGDSYVEALKAKVGAIKPIPVTEQLPPLDVPVYGFWLNEYGLQWWIFTRKFNDEGGWYWCLCESQDVETADDFDITHWLPMIDFEAVEQALKDDRPISRHHENGHGEVR